MRLSGELRSALRAHEDFALEPVPPESRARRALAILNVLLGIPTALVFLATGAELEARFGTASLLSGIVGVAIIVSCLAYVLTLFAARSGLDSDLTSIPAGFGVRGSAVTSAIYSANFFVLFALEDDIIAASVHAQYASVPRWTVLLITGIVLVVLNWGGVASLTVTMAVTLPVFLILIGAFVAKSSAPSHVTEAASGLSWTGLVAVGGALMAFVVNATVSADVGRFLGPHTSRARPALLGVLLQIFSFAGAVGLGAWMEQNLGISNPGAAFVLVLGLWGLIAVASSQLRINLINLYAGSLSLSNFGRRAFGWQPGRAFWSVVLAAVGTGLALTNIYAHLLDVLTFEAVFTCAWIGVLVVAILKRGLITRSTGSSAKVRSFDAAGLAALGVALAASVPIAFGVAGDANKGLGPFVAIGAASLTMWMIESHASRQSLTISESEADTIGIPAV